MGQLTITGHGTVQHRDPPCPGRKLAPARPSPQRNAHPASENGALRSLQLLPKRCPRHTESTLNCCSVAGITRASYLLPMCVLHSPTCYTRVLHSPLTCYPCVYYTVLLPATPVYYTVLLPATPVYYTVLLPATPVYYTVLLPATPVYYTVLLHPVYYTVLLPATPVHYTVLLPPTH